MRENWPKKFIKDVRNRFLVEVSQSLIKLEAEIQTLKTLQEEQREVIDQLLTKFANSGHIRMSENEIITKIFSGAKMSLDPRDLALVPNLVLDGDWERDITKAWISAVKPGSTILDIGANFGYFGLLAAQSAEAQCRVVLFEANPNIIPYLKKTMEINGFNDCSIVENLAISDSDGKLKLNILKDYIASSSIHNIDKINEYNKLSQKVATTVSINSTTIDSYCSRNRIKTVDLIKMDIEGFEEKAYRGMRKIIKDSPNATMFIEFTPKGYEKPKQFYDQMLDDFGYVYLINEQGCLIKPKNTNYSTLITENDGWTMPVFSKSKELAN